MLDQKPTKNNIERNLNNFWLTLFDFLVRFPFIIGSRKRKNKALPFEKKFLKLHLKKTDILFEQSDRIALQKYIILKKE